jgi:hypothetical protein
MKPVWETNMAKHRPTKAVCNLSSLPVIIKEMAIIKLVAASVNESMRVYYVVAEEKASRNNARGNGKF